MLIDGCKNIEVIEWLKELELKSVEIFMKKFLHLGSDNDNESYVKTIERAIKE
jgi:hypothetical protein